MTREEKIVFYIIGGLFCAVGMLAMWWGLRKEDRRYVQGGSWFGIMGVTFILIGRLEL